MDTKPTHKNILTHSQHFDLIHSLPIKIKCTIIRPLVEEPQEVKQSSSNWRPPAQYCLFHLKIKMFFYLQSLVSHFATEKIAVKISNDFS